MPADDIGGVWTSDPVRISQSIKHAGKELDREEKRKQQESDLPERENDTVEINTQEEEQQLTSPIKVHDTHHEETDHSPGANLDVTIG